MPPGYQCIICKGTVPFTGPHEHRLDPCGLVIIGNADRDWREQREQTFYCHFECFRRLVRDDGALYIQDEDFSTNNEVADERAAQEAAGQPGQAKPSQS
jgi:hypothetical protein